MILSDELDLARPEIKAALNRWVSYRLEITEADIMDTWIAEVKTPSGNVVRVEVYASYLYYGQRQVRKFDSTESEAYASIEALMRAMANDRMAEDSR